MITRRIYGCLPFLMYCKFSSLNFTCALCDILGSNSFHFLRIMGIWPLAPMGVPFIHSYADEFIHQKIPWSAWKRCLPALKDFKVSILAAIGTVWMQLPGSQINALSSSDSFCECGFIQGLGSVCGLRLYPSMALISCLPLVPLIWPLPIPLLLLLLDFTGTQLLGFWGSSFEHIRQPTLYLKTGIPVTDSQCTLNVWHSTELISGDIFYRTCVYYLNY